MKSEEGSHVPEYAVILVFTMLLMSFAVHAMQPKLAKYLCERSGGTMSGTVCVLPAIPKTGTGDPTKGCLTDPRGWYACEKASNPAFIGGGTGAPSGGGGGHGHGGH